MLEAAELQQEINSSRDAVLKALSICQDRTIIGQQNAEKVTALDRQFDNYTSLAVGLRSVGNHLVDICKNVEQYLSDKKEATTEALKQAISEAGNIVPDANLNGIFLDINGKKAKILLPNGQNINMREGSALRTVMSTLARYTLIHAQPSALQFVIFDEQFATLSDITSSSMRAYLQKFGENMLIVGIEQRKVLFEGVTDYEFVFTKGPNGKTRVRVLNANQEEVDFSKPLTTEEPQQLKAESE